MMVHFWPVVAVATLASCHPTRMARVEVVSHPQHEQMVSIHMHARFDTMRGIERLLVRGRLDQARGFARSLAIAPAPSRLAPWAAQLELVRARATAVSTAANLEDACRHEARLAEACASCHAETGVQILFRNPPSLLADQPDVVSRMVRHQWAVDRIWEGMVGDAGESWRAGLEVLAAAPVTWPTIGSEQSVLAGNLQQLAEKGRQTITESREERARLYGEILISCAACHGSAL
jgi:cytochrome c553